MLMLEIVAGRLLAPYVGVSLETFTGIIGVVLAGIAAGSWAGGVIADHRDARKLIGAALVIGGALSWLSLPIISALGPQFDDGAVAITMLSLLSLFLPAAVLSAVGPMVAKLMLGDLSDTGAVVGGLSAAGTLGALAGTFITGFLLVSALPTRVTVIAIGVALVLAGAVTHGYLAKTMPTAATMALLLFSGVLGITSQQPCDHVTSYFCANVVVDEDVPTGRSLYLDGLRHAYVDLDDPTNLDIRYIRVFAQVSDALPEGPIDSLHIGGGGMSFPRYLEEVRPGTTSRVLEIDGALVDLVEDELGLVQNDDLWVEVGDARLALDDTADDQYDLVVGDAFASRSVPWHLTTTEFLEKVDRVLRGDGVYVMNIIDGRDFNFVKAEAATLEEVFTNVQVIVPEEGLANVATTNVLLVASQSDLPAFVIEPEDGTLLSLAETDVLIGDAYTLRDDFAPVDQLQE